MSSQISHNNTNNKRKDRQRCHLVDSTKDKRVPPASSASPAVAPLQQPSSSLPLEPLVGPPMVFPLLGSSTDHLKAYTRQLHSFLVNHQQLPGLVDVCGTIASNAIPNHEGGATTYCQRKALVASSIADLCDKLSGFSLEQESAPAAAFTQHSNQRILFVFTGQGAQWPGCGETLMHIPSYRSAAQEVDRLFQHLSGWSLLEKLNTPTSQELCETKYAQPVTFMIQVALVHLLEEVGILPSVVVGHSAGEVVCAYTAGLVSLEDSVRIVYHRSCEQQHASGSGRLLAVGMSQTEALDLLKKSGWEDSVEVACVNSPKSAVLVGPEATLKAIRAALPEEVYNTFVKGNIAFHSRGMDPILSSLNSHLSFLDKTSMTSRVPFISTVTAHEETCVDADYWCRNVREIVNFKGAIEHIFKDQGLVPDLVVEIGPHKTLAGRIAEICRANAQEPMILPTLKRGMKCSSIMADFFSELYEKGMDIDFKALYQSLNFHPIKSMPKAFSSRKAVTTVEVSDITCKDMMDYKMGKDIILPGAYFLEMVLDAIALPNTLADVDFPAPCKIPRASKGESSTKLTLYLADKPDFDEKRSFQVLGSHLPAEQHCAGFVCEGLPKAFDIKNIGAEGLAELKARHSLAVVESREHFYGAIKLDGVVDYGPSFRIARSLHQDVACGTFLASFEINEQQEACFGVQILDGLYQMGFLLPSQDPERVYYPGGFKAAQFLRKPVTKEVYVYLKYSGYQVQGDKKILGDFEVYDAHGNLLSCIKGLYSLMVDKSRETTRLCELAWQPRLTTCDSSFLDSMQARLSPIDTLAGALQATMEQLRSRSPRVVFRILEVVDDASLPTVVGTLSRLHIPTSEDLIVEAFLASNDQSIVPQLGMNTYMAPWLSLRKLFLPALESELSDVCFNAMVLHNQPDASGFTDKLSSCLMPGAQVFVLGAIGARAQKAWATQLKQYGDAKVIQAPTSSFVAARIVPVRPRPCRRKYLFVTEDRLVASQLERGMSKLDGYCSANTLCVKDINLNANSSQKDWADAIGQALSGFVRDEEQFEGVVFLSGLSDDSILGNQAFGQLTRLCQGLTSHKATIDKLTSGSNKKPSSLWIITQGAFTGDIHPSQGTMHGMLSSISDEFRLLKARTIDMASMEELSSVATLLVQPPREQCYLVSPQGILVPRLFPASNVQESECVQDLFCPNACYLVTGGAGGFGSSIVRHAFQQGARHFVVAVTRDPERLHKLFPDLLSHADCTIEAVITNLSREEDVIRLLEVAKSGPFPLRGIFHAAGVSINKMLSRVTMSDFEELAGPKAMAAYYLHKNSMDIDLKAFAVISSVVALIGGRGIVSYCAANSYLDALMRLRRSMGLSGTSFNMGGLSDVGILFKDYKVRQFQAKHGVEYLPSRRAVQDLERAIINGMTQGCEMFFRQQARQVYPNWSSFLHASPETMIIGCPNMEAITHTSKKQVQPVSRLRPITPRPLLTDASDMDGDDSEADTSPSEGYPSAPRYAAGTISMFQEESKTSDELLSVKILEAFRVVSERKGKAVFSTWLGAEGKEEASFTYEEIWTRAGMVADKLRNKLGARKGDRVLLCYGFGLEFFVAILGCFRAGVVAVPVYPPNPSKLDGSLKKLRLIVEDCGATLCLADKQIMTFKNFQSMNPLNYSKWPKNLTWFCSQEVTKGRSFDEMTCEEQDLAFLQYTSGSTGNPKGVMISFANLYHNVAKAMITSFDRTISVARDDLVGVSWLPQYHDMGLMLGIMAPYLLGSRMYHFSPLTFVADPLMWLRTISTYQTHWSTTPTFSLRLCMRRWTALASKGRSTPLDLSSLQAIQIGAEPIFPDHVREFFTTFKACGLQAKLTASYGLAEHVVFVCCNSTALDNMVAHPSVDTLIGHGDVQQMRKDLGVKVIIVDPDTKQQLTSNDEVGEIWLSSPSVAQGYWNMPQLSEETFRATLADDTTKATCSYLRTGDLGRICNGQLYVSGRLKDLIIIGGRNYFPQDIEDAACEASAVVRPGCLAAFEVSRGGKPHVALVFEVREDTKLKLDHEVQNISQRILQDCGMEPAGIFAIAKGAIPKTTSGKIRRRETRDKLLAGNFKVLNKVQCNPKKWSTGIENWPVKPAHQAHDSLLPAAQHKPLNDTTLKHVLVPVSIPPAGHGDLDQPLAIIGMACRFPGGCDDPDSFYKFLLGGGDGIVDMPTNRWPADIAPRRVHQGGFLQGVDKFDAAFFGLSYDEALPMDPQQRVLMEVAYETLCDAGYTKTSVAGTDTGVYIGLTQSGWDVTSPSVPKYNLYTPLGVHPCFGSNRLSYFLGLKGPSLTVDTACASSGTALDIAVHHLATGSCKQALVGAVCIYACPKVFDVLRRLGMLSPDARCKTFDASANGYVRGEGCGVIMIKPLFDALKNGDRIHAIIRGSAMNHGGRAGSMTAPNGAAEQACMAKALERAGINPNEVDFVEAHGTGTAVGDPLEFGALKGLFGTSTRDSSHSLVVGAVKSNIGHLEDAAGIAGIIKAVLVLKNRCSPPNLHLKTLNPHFDTTNFNVTFPNKPIHFRKGGKPLVAVVNSSGFGGANAAMVLEEAPQGEDARASLDRPKYNRKKYPWLLAANNQSKPAPEPAAKPQPQPSPVPVQQSKVTTAEAVPPTKPKVVDETPKPQKPKKVEDIKKPKPKKAVDTDLEGIAGELARLSSGKRTAYLLSYLQELVVKVAGDNCPDTIDVDEALFLKMDSISCTQFVSRLMDSFPDAEDDLLALDPEQTTLTTIANTLLSAFNDDGSATDDDMTDASSEVNDEQEEEHAMEEHFEEQDLKALAQLHPDERKKYLTDLLCRMIRSVRGSPSEDEEEQLSELDSTRQLSDYLDSMGRIELYSRLEETVPFIHDANGDPTPSQQLTIDEIITGLVVYAGKQPESYESNAPKGSSCLPLFKMRKQAKPGMDDADFQTDEVLKHGMASATANAHEPVTTKYQAEQWVKVLTSPARVEQRLIYVPWNGQTWRFPNTETVGVALPRPLKTTDIDPETRDVRLCAKRIIEALKVQGMLDKPLTIFGHCFGCFLSLELCLQLEREHNIIPKRLIVSSMVIAPSKTYRFANIKKAWVVPDPVIKWGMVKLQLAPHELMKRHSADLLVAMFRSNHLAWDRYTVRCRDFGTDLDDAGLVSATAERLRAPITVVHGTRDTIFKLAMVGLSNAKGWQEFSQKPLEVKPITGDHSYLMEKEGAPLMYSFMKQVMTR